MRRTVLIATVALLVPGCGRLSAGPGTSTGPSGGTGTIEHPTGAGDLVVGVAVGGGLLAPSAALTGFPTFSLFGDGTVVTEGAHTEIYPGPVLPSLIQTHVDEAGIQAILHAADDAGLLGPDASYGQGCVADVGTTTFTVDAAGSIHTVSASALGMDTGCSTDAAARQDLETFQGQLGDLRSWLPDGSVGPDEEYRFTEARLIVQPYAGDPSLPEPAIDWPLGSDLATFGDPVGGLADTRCGVVGGSDLDTLMPDLQRANQLTPWQSGGAEYSLLVRPLLPDEHTC